MQLHREMKVAATNDSSCITSTVGVKWTVKKWVGLDTRSRIDRCARMMSFLRMRRTDRMASTRGSTMAASSLRVMRKLLRREPIYCAVVNRYADPAATNFLINGGYQKIINFPLDCYIPTQCHPCAPLSGTHFPPSPQTKDNLFYYYIMDVSSLLPVLALSPEADHSVLDLCAAPGGKAFTLVQFLSLGRSRGGAMALNDNSYGRLKRLKDIVAKCLPKEMRNSVRFTQRRGETWANSEPDSYDRVLVDVPCSSDRHNIEEWIEKDVAYPNTKQFSVLQQELLLAGLHAVRGGGIVAYSTCTLSRTENDEVVCNTLTRAKEEGIDVETMPTHEVCSSLLEICHWSKTEAGVLIAPTETYNCGPMYTSLIQKY